MKVCNACGEEKPLDQFSKHAGRCKPCKAAAQRAYAAAHPEKVRDIDARSRRKHAEKRSAAAKVAYQENRAYYAEKSAKWVRENPLENRLKRNRQRARKAGAEGDFSAAEFLELCDRYGNVCLCCGCDHPLEPDHVVPLSMGGTNWISNIQPLCRSCNASKKNREVDYRDKAAV